MRNKLRSPQKKKKKKKKAQLKNFFLDGQPGKEGKLQKRKKKKPWQNQIKARAHKKKNIGFQLRAGLIFFFFF